MIYLFQACIAFFYMLRDILKNAVNKTVWSHWLPFHLFSSSSRLWRSVFSTFFKIYIYFVPQKKIIHVCHTIIHEQHESKCWQNFHYPFKYYIIFYKRTISCGCQNFTVKTTKNTVTMLQALWNDILVNIFRIFSRQVIKLFHFKT